MILAEDVSAAVIGGFALVMATLLAALVPLWATHRRLGKPNGGGTVVGEIYEARSIARQALTSSQETRELAGTAASAAQLAASMSEANGQKMEELGQRVSSLEREVQMQPGHEVVPPTPKGTSSHG